MFFEGRHTTVEIFEKIQTERKEGKDIYLDFICL